MNVGGSGAVVSLFVLGVGVVCVSYMMFLYKGDHNFTGAQVVMGALMGPDATGGVWIRYLCTFIFLTVPLCTKRLFVSFYASHASQCSSSHPSSPP